MKQQQGLLLFLLTCFFGLLPSYFLYAGSGTVKQPHRMPRTESPVKIDGRLDDAAWKEALALDIKYEVRPAENIEAPVKTKVLLINSRTHLYVAFRAYDPDPSSIRARIRERDNFGGDDWVGIVLDTFNDERRTYNFYCNPLGVQGDEIASPEGGGEGWDAIWNSSGRIDDEGFVVEMAIPFSSLRFQRTQGEQSWGIDAMRSYPRSIRRVLSLFPWDRNNNCYMCQAIKITGFDGAKPGKNLEFDPTLTAQLTQEREEPLSGKFVKRDSSVEPGLTARWGFTPNLTLTAAANPDFSNVETDTPQLDINTQFAIYYAEKRPFFLEGATLFNTRLQAVYTRTLSDPDWGLKVSGKEGRHAIGFFTAGDRQTNLLFPGSTGSRSTALDQPAVGSVLRWRLDVGKSSTLGLVATDREGDDYFNRLAGIDGDIRVTRKDRIRFQVLGSMTQYPGETAVKYNQPEDNMWGRAFDIYYHHDTRTLDWFAGYRDITPEFRADLGFMPQADYRSFEGGLGYTWTGKRNHWFAGIDAGARGQWEQDHDGNTLYKGASANLSYKGPLQSTVNLEGEAGTRTIAGKEFDVSSLSVSGLLRPSRTLFFFASATVGRSIDFANLQGGDRLQLEAFFNLKLSRRLDVSLDHIYERFNVSGEQLYTANVSFLRFVYYFSKRIFFRSILKYVHYKYNSGLYSFPIDPLYKHLFSQVLLSYEINPRTVVYLGYSDDHYGYQHIRLTQSNRTFFVKLGYALVM